MKNLDKLAEVIAEGPQWQMRPGREQIDSSRWGKDHWNLLGYVESVTVDYHGRIDWRRLTLSARNWPMLWAARDNPRFAGHEPTPGRFTSPFGGKDGADEYGLRLARIDGKPVTLFGHCEADALMDFVDHGLVTIEMPRASEDGESYLKPNGRPIHDLEAPVPADLPTGMVEWQLMPWARFRLTGKGRAVANELRDHKTQDGATWSNFKSAAMNTGESGEIA